VDEVGGVKRKDVQRLAAELVDGIEQMRRDLALRDAQVQQLTAERDELLLALTDAAGQLSGTGAFSHLHPHEVLSDLRSDARRIVRATP
jgi:hypothetical protein